MFQFTRRITQTPLLLLLWLTLGLLSACGGGSGSTSEAELQQKLYVSLTDAEGDFTRYQVDVTALRLYRPNGVVVETLPATTTLDFVQYIDVTEFLTAATVPLGAYSRAEMDLDFSQAILSVEDDQGNSIPATAVDDNGDPLTGVTLELLINGNDGFVIRAGQPASLTIDFDLESSNEVSIDTATATATVTVNPVLIASTDVDDDKQRRARGLLAGVDTAAATFDLRIRPFRVRNRDFGQITVHTNDDTVYEIDGVSYGSADGLAQLALLDDGTPVVVLGVYRHSTRQFTADEVFAGSSVPWDDKDVLKGSVIARSGDTLTVLGAVIELADGTFRFNDDIAVVVDADTRVSKQGSDEAVDIGAISVGQRIDVIGEMVDDNTLSAAGSEGLVRMRFSDVNGSVVTVSPLELDLQHINRRNVDRYDFTGTGVDAASDADPAQYQVDTGTLSLNSLQANDPVQVRGFPTPFGSAPLDFTARSIKDVSALPTLMFMGYGKEGSPTAVAALDDNGLLLDLESAVGRHHLKQASIITDINELPSVPLIQPNDGRALYVLAAGRRSHAFRDWQAFSSALTDLLEEGRRVVFATARGAYDSQQLTLTARHLVIRLTRQ